MTVQLSVTYDCLAFHYGTYKDDCLETVSSFQGQEQVSFPRAEFYKNSKGGVILSAYLERLDRHSQNVTYEIYRRAVAAQLVVQKAKKKKAVPRGRVTNLRNRKEVAKVQRQVNEQLGYQQAPASRKQTACVSSRNAKKTSTLLSSNPFAALADMD